MRRVQVSVGFVDAQIAKNSADDGTSDSAQSVVRLNSRHSSEFTLRYNRCSVASAAQVGRCYPEAPQNAASSREGQWGHALPPLGEGTAIAGFCIGVLPFARAMVWQKPRDRKALAGFSTVTKSGRIIIETRSRSVVAGPTVTSFGMRIVSQAPTRGTRPTSARWYNIMGRATTTKIAVSDVLDAKNVWLSVVAHESC
jgi:hypothetical protein